MRHASFASGIGGFDLGFEQASIESKLMALYNAAAEARGRYEPA